MRRYLRHRIGIATFVPAIAFVAAVAHGPPTEEPQAVEATARVLLGTESSVSIVGIQGQISIETGDEREVKVVSRAVGTNGAEIPIGVWQTGSKIVIAPAPGQEPLARYLRVEMPSNLSIAVDATDSTIAVVGGEGGIGLHGTNLIAYVNRVSGSVDADLVGGKLEIYDSSDATLKLSGVDLTVHQMKGTLHLRTTGGKILLAKVEGVIDVDSENSKLLVTDPGVEVHVRAHKGTAVLTGLKAGAALELSETPLWLKEGKGDITVITDADVDFQSMAASLHFDIYGGVLRGKGNRGILEVRTRNTEVNVEAVDEGMRIQGHGLKAKIKDVGGELYIEAKVSDVTVEGADRVVAKLERGNLTLQRVAGQVQAEVFGGDVQIIDGSGPVALEVDGGNGEVSWADLSGSRDSHLTNKSGSLTVHFPSSGTCRIEAKSQHGRVESDLPTVRLSGNGDEAQGQLNGGARPVVKIDAIGDIRLITGSAVHEEN